MTTAFDPPDTLLTPPATSFDALIAGAGPSGCAAAFDLAAAGKRVLLLDKRSFPRHKPCACGLTRKTLAALRYSVDPVIERVCNEVILQPAETGTEVRVHRRHPICAMAVRDRFDEFCLQQTLAAGRNGGSVQLRRCDALLALRESTGSVDLDIQTADGIETLTAPVLVGADGSNGQTRRLAAALRPCDRETASDPSWYTRAFALEAAVPYDSLPVRLPGGRSPLQLVFDFGAIAGGYGWLFPKDTHINIGVGIFVPPGSTAASGDPSHELQLKRLTRSLLLDYAHRKLGIATLPHISGQHLGIGGHLYVPRGRVLLTGDAAGLVDPLTGEGIHSAIVSGQAAAAAILSCARSTAQGNDGSGAIAAAYIRNLRPLQQTLAFSHRAALAFYAEPERGFRAMRLPILRSLVLKTYADGLPRTGLINALARLLP